MADISYTIKATPRKDAVDAVVGKGDANTLKVLASVTKEVPVSADGDTMFVGRIASNARISGLSRAYWDDLTTNATTMDIGLGSVNSNITSDPNAIADGLDVATATTTGGQVITEIANNGKYAWQFVNGQTTDPGGQLDIYASFVDAATSIVATVSIEVMGYTD